MTRGREGKRQGREDREWEERERESKSMKDPARREGRREEEERSSRYWQNHCHHDHSLGSSLVSTEYLLTHDGKKNFDSLQCSFH
jgi:hypothetical protein